MLVSGAEVVPSIDLGRSRLKLCHPSDVLSWYTQEIVFAGAHQPNLLCSGAWPVSARCVSGRI